MISRIMANTGCVCKGLCKRFDFTSKKLKLKPFSLSGGFYNQGFKRCGQCGIYMKLEGGFCPCCGRKLQVRPPYSREKHLPERLYIS